MRSGRPKIRSSVPRLLSCAWLLLACAVAQACARTSSARPEAGTSRIIDGVIILGGVIVQHGEPHTTADLALERTDGRLVLKRVLSGAELSASDTIHAAGLYIHSAHTFEPRVLLHPAAPALYVIRSGQSPGSPAAWVVRSSGWRRLEVAENHPAGAVDERVGCYNVEVDSAASPRFPRIWFATGVRLHWQYLWHHLRETSLVATDRDGAVPGPPGANYHVWKPIASDSLQVDFATTHGFQQSVSFRLVRAGDDYTGEAAWLIHNATAPSARASVRFRRVACPPR